MRNREEKYNEAANMYNSGFSIQEIAKCFSVSRQSMWAILKRRGVNFRTRERSGNENTFFRGGNNYKKTAHHVIEKAIIAGKIQKESCEICGCEENIEAHHDDYSKPLSVRWLCRKHHYEWHKSNTAKNGEIE